MLSLKKIIEDIGKLNNDRIRSKLFEFIYSKFTYQKRKLSVIYSRIYNEHLKFVSTKLILYERHEVSNFAKKERILKETY